ncbi:MAG: chromosomal replication initiator protein DnaA [Clostridiales bacterium]|jgi:chromosomal replication initiator protein|nr:chromosomal replication initiator protein DnaA [Clostridiales bacterium]
MDEHFLQQYWDEALNLIEHNVNEVAFEVWIKSLQPLCLEDNILFLKAREVIYKDTIESRYLHEITNSFNAVANGNYEVSVVLSPEDIKKKVSQSPYKALLNRRYLFETFVPGKSNEMAYAAALAVAEAPGQTNTYNPLYLYGGVGLGKTHIMQAIGNFILEQNPECKVLYVTTEAFTNELVHAIREGRNEAFRNKYRVIDTLLIDDIQFLSGKDRTQEEFFHTFNTLYESGKQIVISSDQAPKEIKGLENRLRSRFACGLPVDVTLPDFETRMAILEKKAQFNHIILPVDVTEYIAKSITSNIRDLEGTFNRVTAYAKLNKSVINIELAKKVVSELIGETEKREINIDLIQEIVAEHYNITIEEMKGKRRTQNIAFPRQVAMYLCRKIIDKSLPKIGEAFGGRDHSTVIHGCDKITDMMENDLKLQNTLFNLENKIKE